MNLVIDLPLVAFVTAFVKQRYNLKGDAVFAVVLVVVLVLSFIPDLIAAFPQYALYLERVIDIVKLVLAAPGAYDLAVNLKNKAAG